MLKKEKRVENARKAVAGVAAWWLYALLLALQTIGIIILYWTVLPPYREWLANPSSFQPPASVEAWALPAIALIQFAYWMRWRIRPALPWFQNAFAGHVVLFIARLSFILPTTMFALHFIAKTAKPVTTSRYLIIIAGLFSVFCYMQELQQLGNILIGGQVQPGREPR
jgi:hypothetical protein